jgi:endonuclease YncB( thermonuclease family)
MSEFTVSEVIDGDTFKVSGGWQWNGRKGDTVRPIRYDTPEKGEYGYGEAKQKLENLILYKNVEIKNAQAIDAWGRLIADVFYQGRNLADYFPNYKK